MCFAVLVIAPRTSAKVSGFISICANCSMFALWSWMLTPILVGAGPALTLVTLVVPLRLLRRPWPIALLAALATLAPWLLQPFGVPAGFTVDGPNLILHTAASNLEPVAVLVGVSFYIAALILMTGLFVRIADDDRRAARRKMQTQTWQLRQLMPKPTTLR
ncbi:MAG: hypothetical protein H0V17_20615 [Deltaproteobacteria bacterium]|nr:hypothetical protein [Deltaproteobacteria bacterium]